MTRRRLTGSRWIAVGLALVCVIVAAVALRLSEPDDHELNFGVVGAPVAFNGGEITVTDVRVGTVLSKDGEVQADTPGMFVVLTVQVRAPGRKVTVNKTELSAGSYHYDAFGVLAIAPDAGYQATADAVFEVDPAHIAGLQVEFSQLEVVSGYQEHVVIPLGITTHNADEWRAASVGTTLEITSFPLSEVIR